LDWPKLRAAIRTRSHSALNTYYHKKYKTKLPSSSTSKKSSAKVARNPRTREPWTEKEIDLLHQGIERYGRSGHAEIAEMIRTRTPLQVKVRISYESRRQQNKMEDARNDDDDDRDDPDFVSPLSKRQKRTDDGPSQSGQRRSSCKDTPTDGDQKPAARVSLGTSGTEVSINNTDGDQKPAARVSLGTSGTEVSINNTDRAPVSMMTALSLTKSSATQSNGDSTAASGFSSAHVSNDLLRPETQQQQQQQQQQPQLQEHQRECIQDRRTLEIRNWLVNEVIPWDPDIKEMEAYALKFREIGLHSVGYIQSICTPAHVKKFDWMLPFHRMSFLQRAGLRNKGHEN